MTSVAISQLTLDFEPALAERFPTLRQYINHRLMVQTKPAKVVAAEMDLSPSTLSRKLTAGVHPDDKDTQRFNTEDLEGYLAATGDVMAVIEYLAAKYSPGGDDARRMRAIARVETLAADLERTLATLRGGA